MRFNTLALITLALSSQWPLLGQTRGDLFSDTYTTNQGWTQINTGVSIVGGVVKAEYATAYQTPRRVFKALPKTIKSSDNWRLETDFIDQTASDEFSVYDLVALTYDNYDPHVTCGTLDDDCLLEERNVDNLLIRAGKPTDNNKVHIYIKINNVGTSVPVFIESFQSYYITLEKRDSVFTLTLFTDAARQHPAPNFPVTLTTSKPLPDYKYIQHAVATSGGNFRVSSFTIDNTYLTSLPKEENCNVISETYSTPEGWEQINTDVTIANGQVKATNATAYLTQQRIYKKLDKGIAPSDDWVVMTTFMDQTKANEFSVYDFLALTYNEYDPQLTCTTPKGGCSPTPNLYNNILLRAGKPENSTSVHTYLLINNGPNTPAVDIQSNVLYYVKLEKKGTVYTLGFYTDPACRQLVPGFPTQVDYAAALPTLNYLQHAVATAGGNFRISSFVVDNTCISSKPSVVTGLFSTSLTNKLQIIPNPATETIKLQIEDAPVERVEIYTTQGQLVLQTAQASTLPIGTLSKGSYIVKVNNGTSVFTAKLMVE